MNRRPLPALAPAFAPAVALTVACLAVPAGAQPATQPADPTPTSAAVPAPYAGAASVGALEEMLVTATGFQAERLAVPYSADVVTAEQFERRQYRTTPQALRDIPGVMVQETAFGQGSPFIRGFTGPQTLLLVDGIRVNNSVFRQGPNQYWNTVDPYSVERFEVVKGPSSVLYGSDAIGGTVNAITQGPYTYGSGVNVGGQGLYRFASAEHAHAGNAELSVTGDNHWGVLLDGSLKTFGDVEGGRNVGNQPGTGYDEYDVHFKAEHWFSDRARLVVAHQRVRLNNVPRTHRTVDAVPFAGTTVGSDLKRELDQERELTYVQLRGEGIDGPVESFVLSGSWQRQEEVRDRVRGSGARELQGFEAGTFGLWGRATSDTRIGKLTYGFEYYHDNVNSFSTTNTIQGPVADDATYDLFGLYLQNAIPVTDRLTLTLGGRFTYAAADADSVEDPDTGNPIRVDDDWSSLVGSARLAYFVVPEKLNVFGGVSQGFRAPNLSDLTRVDTARTNEFETPAPGLEPEDYLTFEIGAKGRFDRWSFQAAYFYTLIDDQIIRVPTGNVVGGDFEVTKLNGGDGFIQGIELGAAVELTPQLTAFGNLTYLDGEITSFPDPAGGEVDTYPDRLMPLTGQVGLRWDPADLPGWAEGQVLMAAKADRLSPRDEGDTSRIPPGGTPGYGVLNLRGGWSPTENVDLIFGIDNVLDKDYRIHGSGTNMPGRNFILTAVVRF